MSLYGSNKGRVGSAGAIIEKKSGLHKCYSFSRDLEHCIGKENEPFQTRDIHCLDEAHGSRFMKDGDLIVGRCTRQRPGLSVAQLLACSYHICLIYVQHRPDCQISAVSWPRDLNRDSPAK